MQGLNPSSAEVLRATKGDTSMVGLNRHISPMKPARKEVIDMTQADQSDSQAALSSGQNITAGRAPRSRQLPAASQAAATEADAAAREAARAAVEAAVVHRPEVRQASSMLI